MKSSILLLLLAFFVCIPVNAQEFNNRTKEYSLVSQTEARIEMGRTHRQILCDYQPSGLYVRRGETITLSVSNLDDDYKLSSMIGFKPMWGNRNKTQEDELEDGENTVKVTQDGPLWFIFVKREGFDDDPSSVDIKVKGGKAFPLYIVGETEDEAWENDLRTMKDAPFVQLLSDRASVTITYPDYLKNPIEDVEAAFETIHKVLDLEEEVAGFDGSTPQNKPTRNRIHFAIDLYSTPEEAAKYYLYASQYFIGMKRTNYNELTHALDKEWGIWHEIGHLHQQRSWTWGAISEISVNIFSLYVQEQFGLPSKLDERSPANGPTHFENARKYIANPDKNYLVRNPSDYSEFFSKLVMFYQLRAVYGWDMYKRLHQHFRKQPYVYNPKETDADKANKFVYAICLVSKNDLVPFFKKWGLNIDAATAQKIAALKLPLPKTDPSTIFK